MDILPYKGPGDERQRRRLARLNRRCIQRWVRSVLAIVIGIPLLGILGIFAIASFLSWDPSWTNSSVESSMATGDKLVAALEQYHRLHGRYPPQLQEMVPEEIPSVDKPTAGDGTWEYGSPDVSAFDLIFASSRSMDSCEISSNNPHWLKFSVKPF